jgi:endonuclease-3
MNKKERCLKIRETLERMYPNPPAPLDHRNAFELLVAVALSAQTTDKRVNLVTPALFARAPNARALARLEVEEILTYIKTVGLAPTKAKNLKKMAEALVAHHGGEVPADMEALEQFAGVGHKTASVVVSQAFGQPAFPVDTHIHRLAKRWGLSDGSSVEQTERDLKRLFPQECWNTLHVQIILFGREHCPALRHVATQCPICSWAGSKRA